MSTIFQNACAEMLERNKKLKTKQKHEKLFEIDVEALFNFINSLIFVARTSIVLRQKPHSFIIYYVVYRF